MAKTLKHRRGCLCCPASEDYLPMDTALYNAFGGYTVYKNEEHYFSEDPAEDKEWEANKTLAEIEEEAKKEPTAKWEVFLFLPLRGATWTRQEDGQWLLTDTNQGFA